jgi:hypothetical protein
MIPADSMDNLDFRPARVRESAYRNASLSTFSVSRMARRSNLFSRFIRTIINWKRRDRYLDTGESGETYDAEMEAAAAQL